MARVIRRAIAGCLIAIIVISLLKAFVTKPSAGSSKPVASLPTRPDAYFLEMSSSDGRRSKEYVSGQRKRLESYDANSELSQLYIYRSDKGVSWVANLGAKTLLEFPDSPEVERSRKAMAKLVAWKEEGTEVIQGCKCTRFVGRYVPQAAGYFFMGSGAAHEESFIDASNGLPVRHVTYDRQGKATIIDERVAFSLDPPDPEMFEAPQGFEVQRVELNR